MTRDANAHVRLLAALLVTWLGVAASFIGLKLVVASVPPFTLAGTRYVLAGGVLLVWWLRREGLRPRVRPRELGLATLSGVLLILGCQGGITWAVQYLTPGIAAVIASTVPLWVTLLSWAFFRAAVGTMTIVGLAAGFGGVAFLTSSSLGTGVPLFPALVVTAGALSWAVGSLVVARTGVGTRPVMVAAVQMVTGGTLQLAVGLFAGDWHRIDPARLGVGQAVPFLLLLVVPSLVGYPVFSWLLAHAQPEVANTQAYIAPVIALVLGWLLLGLPVSGPAWIASTVILGGVALMVTRNAQLQRQSRQLTARVVPDQ